MYGLVFVNDVSELLDASDLLVYDVCVAGSGGLLSRMSGRFLS